MALAGLAARIRSRTDADGRVQARARLPARATASPQRNPPRIERQPCDVTSGAELPVPERRLHVVGVPVGRRVGWRADLPDMLAAVAEQAAGVRSAESARWVVRSLMMPAGLIRGRPFRGRNRQSWVVRPAEAFAGAGGRRRWIRQRRGVLVRRDASWREDLVWAAYFLQLSGSARLGSMLWLSSCAWLFLSRRAQFRGVSSCEG